MRVAHMSALFAAVALIASPSAKADTRQEVERLPEIVKSCKAIPRGVARLIFISLDTLDAVNKFGSPEARAVSTLPAYARDPISVRRGGFVYQFGTAQQPIYLTAPEFSWDRHPARIPLPPQPFWAYHTVGMAVFDLQSKDIAQFRVVLSPSRKFNDPPFKPYPGDVPWTPPAPLASGGCNLILYQFI